MPRLSRLYFALLILCAGLGVLLGDAPLLFAQPPAAANVQLGPNDWPPNLDQLTSYVPAPDKFVRGPGDYFSPTAIVFGWLVFLGWVWTTDWVNQDGIRTKGRYWLWNQIVVGSFAAAGLVVWLIDSSFWLTMPLLVIAWVAPLGLYIRQRNAAADDADKVLTPGHLRFVLAPILAKVGVKLATESRAARRAAGPPIELVSRSAAKEPENQALTLQAKHHAGFVPLAELLIEAIQQRAGSVMLDFTRERTTVKLQVDSVWIDHGVRDRPVGDAMLACLKTLVGGKPEDRAGRQRGKLLAVYETKKYPARFSSGGTKTGERAIVLFENPQTKKFRLTDIGVHVDRQEALKTVLLERKGLVIVSAPPNGGGLTSLMTAVCAGVDRYMRSAIAMEDANNKELDVENVPVKTYDAAAGITPAATLTEIVRQYPDVIVVPELIDGPTTATLCEQASEDRLVIAGLRARGAAESLLRVLMLKVPPKALVPVVTAAVNQRLIRKLCESCREEYPAPAPVLQSLRLSPDKVKSFFRPPTPQPGEKPKPCPECNNTGYRGVTALVEVLIVNDTVRAALAKQPSLESVTQAAHKAGMRTLQEEGIQLVAAGVTSLAELKRVLTEPQAAAAASSS